MHLRGTPGRRPPGRDLQRLFAATIVLPGLLLTIVGIRAWLQDGVVAQQRLRERIERGADIAIRAVEQELRDWQRLVDRVDRQRPAGHELPSGLRAAFAEPGVAVLIRTDTTTDAWPERQLPYRDGTTIDVVPPEPHPLAQAAASAEWREHDYARAAALYRRAVPLSAPDARTTVLNQLARTLRKAGDQDGARQVYASLVDAPGHIGLVPADLVARFELALPAGHRTPAGDSRLLLAFYTDLVHGRWQIEETRYRFYSERSRGELEGSALRIAVEPIRRIELRKMSLARAARSAREASEAANRSPDVVVIRSTDSPTALLVSRDWLQATHWPSIFRTTIAADFDVRLRGPDGDLWFETRPPARASIDTAVTRQVESGGRRWALTVAPRNPAALMADVARWRALNLVMLTLVVGLLGFGTYLTTRAVRRELEVARLQSDFVSAVSHEFRSPLTGIRQLGEMLLRGRVPDEARRLEYYARITHESDRLGRLVENLLQAAQLDEGRQHFRRERIDTAAWLRNVVDDARSQLAHRHAVIEADIPAELPSLVGDREALTSAVSNLLDNAVKYSPPAAPVRCEAREHDGLVTICVRDRGAGMSEEDRAHAFERFRRGRSTITEQVKGTGLGLSLVHDIVVAHGGRVDCDSRLGEGTTFSIRLAASEGS